MIGITREVEGGQESDDRNGTLRVEEVPVYLRLDLFHPLGDIAGDRCETTEIMVIMEQFYCSGEILFTRENFTFWNLSRHSFSWSYLGYC